MKDKTFTLTKDEQDRILWALDVSIRDSAIKRNRCSVGSPKWREHEDRVDGFSKLISKFR